MELVAAAHRGSGYPRRGPEKSRSTSRETRSSQTKEKEIELLLSQLSEVTADKDHMN